jgi:hypothetical protein
LRHEGQVALIHDRRLGSRPARARPWHQRCGGNHNLGQRFSGAVGNHNDQIAGVAEAEAQSDQ